MKLNQGDWENIYQAMDQMIFRCTRNRNLARDAVEAGGDGETRTELALLEESLLCFEETARRVDALHRRLP